HGLANAMVMEDIMELFYPAVHQELDDLFSYLQISKEDFFAWLHSLSFERKIDLSDDFIDKAIPQITGSRNMALNPLPVNEKQIRAILANLKK
ncbi:MAG TPA: alcohol dehydrogenase, partial [Candidatus Cloacimonas sp.]|nr:alcohol dehydrogenase [Candidatus Cloacimonas sp.]